MGMFYNGLNLRLRVSIISFLLSPFIAHVRTFILIFFLLQSSPFVVSFFRWWWGARSSRGSVHARIFEMKKYFYRVQNIRFSRLRAGTLMRGDTVYIFTTA
jgi:hypothetical protein